MLRPGTPAGRLQLTHAIETYLAERNLSPKPYRWRADGASILRKIHAARAVSVSEVIKGSVH